MLKLFVVLCAATVCSACRYDSECGVGYCESRTCRFKKQNGEYCDRHPMCVSGLCMIRTCEAPPTPYRPTRYPDRPTKRPTPRSLPPTRYPTKYPTRSASPPTTKRPTLRPTVFEPPDNGPCQWERGVFLQKNGINITYVGQASNFVSCEDIVLSTHPEADGATYQGGIGSRGDVGRTGGGNDCNVVLFNHSAPAALVTDPGYYYSCTFRTKPPTPAAPTAPTPKYTGPPTFMDWSWLKNTSWIIKSPTYLKPFFPINPIIPQFPTWALLCQDFNTTFCKQTTLTASSCKDYYGPAGYYCDGSPLQWCCLESCKEWTPCRPGNAPAASPTTATANSPTTATANSPTAATENPASPTPEVASNNAMEKKIGILVPGVLGFVYFWL